jgi:hypothetical protein
MPACDAPVAGGRGRAGPLARAEALDRGPTAGRRAGGEVLVAPDLRRRSGHGLRDEAGQDDVPGRPAGPDREQHGPGRPAGPDREQHALQQDEERPDPEAEGRHLSAR